MSVHGGDVWFFAIFLIVGSGFALATKDYTTDMNEVRLAMMSYACGSTPASKCTPSNKFLGVIGELEKTVFAAKSQRYRPSEARVNRIKKYIELANKYKSKRFSLDSLGSGLFTSMKLSSSTPVGKRSLLAGAKTFLEAVKKELGGKVFDKVISVKGDVTLIFVIDDTGSMGKFIAAAKALATTIVNTKRDYDVDYILSPYNDPTTGSVTRMESDQKQEFVKAIGNLRANGGGDCPELAFKGMMDAIAEGPNLASPMFVFTDATAKDYNKINMENLLDEAYSNEININFFVRNNPCHQQSYKPYEELAEKTCGQMIYLPSSAFLTHLTGLAEKSLLGKTCLEAGGFGYGPGKRRKRAAGDSVYYITVDDITDSVMITVRTAKDSPVVTLAKPNGAVVSDPSVRISVGKVVIYDIKSPSPGRWKLTVSASAGSHSYGVQGSSKSNVDFSYFFMMIPTVGRNREPIPVPYPLTGVKAMAIVTLAGADKIQTSSLTLTLVDTNGNFIKGADSFTPQGKSGFHFLATVTPPPGPFKLLLKGNTKGGYPFKRNSRTVIRAKSAVLTLLYTRHDQTIPGGGTSYAFLILHNTGKTTETFTITATDNFGAVYSFTRSKAVRSKGAKTIVVRVRAKVSDRGKTASVFVRATGGTSKVVTGYVLSMLVV